MTSFGTRVLSSCRMVTVATPSPGSAARPTPQSAVPAVTASAILSSGVGTTDLNSIEEVSFNPAAPSGADESKPSGADNVAMPGLAPRSLSFVMPLVVAKVVEQYTTSLSSAVDGTEIFTLPGSVLSMAAAWSAVVLGIVGVVPGAANTLINPCVVIADSSTSPLDSAVMSSAEVAYGFLRATRNSAFSSDWP